MYEEPASLSWQRLELERYLQENEHNALVHCQTVRLANPRQKVQLDQVIREQIWPAVIRALEGTAIRVFNAPDGFPAQGIEDKWTNHTTRCLTFVLEDPARPLSVGSFSPWFCRGHLKCSALDYMASFDFHIYFPADFSIRRIMRILADPMFAGCPPTLSIDPSSQANAYFVVFFGGGSGAGWGLHSHEEAARAVAQSVKRNVAVIDAVYGLERDYRNGRAFNGLRQALRQGYAAY